MQAESLDLVVTTKGVPAAAQDVSRLGQAVADSGQKMNGSFTATIERAKGAQASLSSMASSGVEFIKSQGDQLAEVVGQMSNAEATIINLEKVHSAMRASLLEEDAAKRLRTQEQEANATARLQAKQEAEYLRVDAQARSAEAAMNAAYIERKMAIEMVSHQTRLSSLAGNDEAMEAEMRRHEAVMTTIQSDMEMKGDRATRGMIRSFGRLSNQMGGLQMAFMGVGMAMDGTEAKSLQMIGRTGMMASGAIGMAQAFQMSSEAMGGLSLATGGALAAIVAVGVGLGLLFERQKELKELAKNNDWLLDESKLNTVKDAIKEYDDKEKALGETVKDNTAYFGSYYGMLDTGAEAVKHSSEATKKLLDITGHTREELEKLYGSGQIDSGMIKYKAATDAYAQSLSQVAELEAKNKVISAQAQVDVSTVKNDPVEKVRIESQAKIKEMENSFAIQKAKLVEFQSELEKAEVQKDQSLTEKAKQEAGKKIEAIEKQYDREKATVKYGEEELALLINVEHQKVTDASAEQLRKQEENNQDASDKAEKIAMKHQKIIERQLAEERSMIAQENEKKKKLNEEYTRRMETLDKQVLDSKLALATDMADAFGKMTGAAKVAFLANKAIAATGIVLNNLSAQAAAAAPPPIGVGPLLAPGLIAELEAEMAYQLAGVAATTLQGFAEGGFVQGPYSSGDRILVRANAGEAFLTPAQQQEFMNIANGGGAKGNSAVNHVQVTYAPVYPAMHGGNQQTFTEMARNDRVEFSRFIEQELKKKGYIN